MKTNYRYMITLAVVAITVSCSDFLEMEVPKDQIDQSKVFNDDRTATSALTEVYTLMRNNGFLSGNKDGMGFLMGCYTDELEVTAPQVTDYKYFYESAVLSTNTAVQNLWNNTYRQLYLVNNVLEGLEHATEISEPVQRQLRGEALAVRGLLHFYLCQTYGDVPYVTGTDYSVNRRLGKVSVPNVMHLALQDLTTAEDLLDVNYPSVEKVRINKVVTQAILARVYLFAGKYPEAKNYAQMVIENPIYGLENVEDLFLKDSTSAIWQFKPAVDTGNALEADTYFFPSSPAPYAKLSTNFLQDFEMGDLREVYWTKHVGTQGDAYASKYKQRGFSVSAEYSVIMRVEEMYLIAAEASAQIGEFAQCEHYLNLLRIRAQLPLVATVSKDECLAAVMQERRVELFCEFGHRFYDLKRWKLLDVKLSPLKNRWQSQFEVLPLPEKELLLNPGLLPQNVGY